MGRRSRVEPDGTTTVKRILVPVDFSKPSLAALRYAGDLARNLNATLDIVHVVEVLTYAPLVGSAIDVERLRVEQERAAERASIGSWHRAASAGRAGMRLSGQEAP